MATPFVYPSPKVAQVSWDPATNAITPDTQLPGWVFTTKLVAKPDQLIKRRGKAGLLALNKSWEEAKEWIQQRAGKPQKVSADSVRLLSSLRPLRLSASAYPLPPARPSVHSSCVSTASHALRTRRDLHIRGLARLLNGTT